MRRFLTFTALAALAIWGLISFRAPIDSGWRDAGNGLQVRTIERRSGLSKLTISAVRASANRVHVASGSILRAPAWIKKFDALAAINGGYFDEQTRAIGLRIADGKRTNPFYSKANWGVFTIRDGKAAIAHTRDYQGSPTTQQAMQCGPRLVVNGQPTDLKPQSARRSGLGITAGGQVILAVCDGALSFDEWAKVWADDLQCRDAINLDGGPSTQLTVTSEKHPINVRGGWPIPDAIVVK